MKSDLPEPLSMAIHLLLVKVGAADSGEGGDTKERVQIAYTFLRSKIDRTKMEAITSKLANDSLSYIAGANQLEEELGAQHHLEVARLVNNKLGFPNDEICESLGGWASRIPFLGQGVAGKGWRRFIKRL